MKKKLDIRHILIGGLILYVIGVLINQQIVISNIKKEQSINMDKLNKLKQKNEELQDQVKMSQSPNYIEKVAREKLNMIKKGEIPIVNDSSK